MLMWLALSRGLLAVTFSKFLPGWWLSLKPNTIRRFQRIAFKNEDKRESVFFLCQSVLVLIALSLSFFLWYTYLHVHRALEGSSYLKTVEIFSEFKELSLSLGDVHTADWSLPSQMSSRCLASKRFLSANQGSVKGGSVLHITSDFPLIQITRQTLLNKS